MVQIKKLVAQFKQNPKTVKFNDLVKVCDYYFGDSRQSGSRHRVYKTPWQGAPRVNIQNKNGYGKPSSSQASSACNLKNRGDEK